MDLGNLGGLYPPSDGVGFNEVIASAYLPFSQSTTSTTGDYVIPFSFNSPAELDVVLTNTGITLGTCVVSGSPDGLACTFVYSSSTVYATIQLIGQALRITTTGATAAGAMRILRRNRRVKNSAQLAAASAESPLPFTISDPHKAMLVNNNTQGVAASHTFIDEFITDTGKWNSYDAASANRSVRIVSPSMYITNSSTFNPYLTLVEFDTP